MPQPKASSGHKLIFTEDESILLTDKNGNVIKLDTQGKNIEFEEFYFVDENTLILSDFKGIGTPSRTGIVLYQNKQKISILNNEEILKKMKNNSKFIIGLLVLFLFISCKTAQKKQEKEKEEKEYANYLETYHSDFFQKYSKRQVIYYDYFDKFLAYKREQERQIQLKKSDLKLNEVYYYYYGDICLVLFSDDGRMYHNKFNINHRFVDVIGDTLVKIKEPIELWSYASFELKDNKLYTLTKERVPYREWYETITYNFRNDSIIADKMYKSNLHHKKKWLAITREAYNIRMVCKPTLEIAEDFVIIEGHKIKHYIVTGEFLLK